MDWYTSFQQKHQDRKRKHLGNRSPIDPIEKPALLLNLAIEKRCSKCKEVKPLTSFYKRGKSPSKPMAECKLCVDNRNKKYTKEHAGQVKERAKQYRKNNPEKIKDLANNYRHRKRANGGNVTGEEWEELKEKYGNKCLRCGKNDVPLTKDHVVPVSQGGAHVIENIQPLCKSCNSKKRTKHIDYRTF